MEFAPVISRPSLLKASNHAILLLLRRRFRLPLEEDEEDEKEACPVSGNDIANGIKHVYDIGIFQGIASHFRPEALHLIHANSAVAYVERDSMGRLAKIRTQHNATWRPARISQRCSLAVKQKDAGEAAFDYGHDTRGGCDFTVFVIDTEINLEHKELEVRAEWRIMAVEGGMTMITMDMGHIARAL
ncbi:serine protease [Haplosporangium gracile]|nr:serine protease [Haplosporangium gracile]